MAIDLNTRCNIKLMNSGTKYYIVVPDEYYNVVPIFYNADMSHAFEDCNSLVFTLANGNIIVNNHIQNMQGMYKNDTKLTGAASCPPNVIDMSQAFYGCTGLTGAAAFGDKVTNIAYAYYNCKNLTGNAYWNYNTTSNSSALINFAYAFQGHNNSKQIGIICKPNSAVNNALYNNSYYLFGGTCTWTKGLNCYYNVAYNIYVYYDVNPAVGITLDTFNLSKTATSYEVVNATTARNISGLV